MAIVDIVSRVRVLVLETVKLMVTLTLAVSTKIARGEAVLQYLTRLAGDVGSR